MKKTLFAICCLSFAILGGDAVGAATCSKSNLTTCLDSVCGTNVGMNPAARCQLCGTSAAGTATSNGLKSLSIGASSKYTISDKDQKIAPSDAGAKYIWATEQCIKKIDGCTTDDVSAVYDSLIEQSCRAAGISAEMANLHSAVKKTKSQNTCNTEISACLVDAKHCGADLTGCAENAEFDKHFSLCVVDANGCDAFATAIRGELIVSRNTAVQAQDTLVANIVRAYQSARDAKLKTAEESCKNGTAMTNCVETVCANNMRNKCAAGFQSETSMATLLCTFNNTACDRIKK